MFKIIRFKNFLALFGLCCALNQGCHETADLQNLRADQINYQFQTGLHPQLSSHAAT
jgi:hypothetical protein